MGWKIKDRQLKQQPRGKEDPGGSKSRGMPEKKTQNLGGKKAARSRIDRDWTHYTSLSIKDGVWAGSNRRGGKHINELKKKKQESKKAAYFQKSQHLKRKTQNKGPV